MTTDDKYHWEEDDLVLLDNKSALKARLDLLADAVQKFNPNHDERGRFTYGSMAEAAVPRHGSKKHQVYQTYVSHGRAAAIAQAKELGLAPGTAQGWTGTWNRQGTPGGTAGVPAPTNPGVVKPTTPRLPPSSPRDIKLYGKSFNEEKIRRGINAIPQEHRELLAKRGVTVEMRDTVKVPGYDHVQGVYETRMFSDTGRIRLADRTEAFGASSKVSDPTGTVVHELGHAIDHASNWNHGNHIAKYVDEDAKQMSSTDRQWAKYFFSNNRERFAELYRTAYTPGPKAFGMQTARARRIFAKSIQAMKEADSYFKWLST